MVPSPCPHAPPASTATKLGMLDSTSASLPFSTYLWTLAHTSLFDPMIQSASTNPCSLNFQQGTTCYVKKIFFHMFQTRILLVSTSAPSNNITDFGE